MCSVYGKRALDDAVEVRTPVAEGDEGALFEVWVEIPEK